MSQRGTLLIILVQNRHYFKRRSLGWHIVALGTWPSILLHEQTVLFFFLFFNFTVEASCFSTGLQLDLKVTKWWQLLLFAWNTFGQSEKLKSGTNMFTPHDTCLRLICKGSHGSFFFFFLSAPIYSTFYDSCNERILYTRNRNMSCKCYKKATPLYSR